MKPRSHRSRRSRQRGAEMVEVCLVLTPLLTITFLLLNLSMAIFLRSTFQQAVREGARYAITGQVTRCRRMSRHFDQNHRGAKRSRVPEYHGASRRHSCQV